MTLDPLNPENAQSGGKRIKRKQSRSRSRSRSRKGGTFLADVSVPTGLLLLNQYMKNRKNKSKKKSSKSKNKYSKKSLKRKTKSAKK